METAAVQCTCCGHGEAYLSPGNVLSRSHGGELHGARPARASHPGEFSGNAELSL
jgi:hypothetical protein